VTPSDLRALVPDLGSTIYLNTAAMAAGCAPVRAAYTQALERWAAGRFDWSQAERAGEAARAGFARLIGARASEIAIVPSVSAAAGLVAMSLAPPKPGENILVGAGEFSSNYFPWRVLEARGYDVRAVPFDEHGPSEERFASGMSGRIAEMLDKVIGYFSEEGAFQIAEVYGARGDADAAFAWLERAFEQHDPGLSVLMTAEFLGSLHGDPRWNPFLEKMGFRK